MGLKLQGNLKKMKKTIKIYLEPEDVERLKLKAEASGFVGRGCLSGYIEKICKQPICFLDENVKALLSVLKLQQA